MKAYSELLISLIIILFVFSCNENTTKKQLETPKKQAPIDTIKQLTETSNAIKKENIPQEQYDYLFVIAKSGLNYRDTPKGKVLGKFPLNTQLKIIKSTKIQDQISDEKEIIKGEWVATEKDKDTVYVFNGFLSHTYLMSDIKLYDFSPYYKENNGDIRTAFLNLSDTYFENTYNENSSREKPSILTENDILKDTIKLNLNQRKTLLQNTTISEADRVFIYTIQDAKTTILKVKDLPVIACINIYSSGSSDYKKEELDYELGFDLGHHAQGDFVYVGQNNPFLSEKLTSIIWKKTDKPPFPENINPSIKKQWLNNRTKKGNYYTFSNNNLEYFIQDIERKNLPSERYLVVINSQSNEVVYNKIYSESESTYLVPLQTNENDRGYGSQWTGNLFKNKKTVLFGLLSHSFDCPSVTVLDNTEPAVRILCDNRH